MPYTVPIAFDQFISNISVTKIQVETAEARRKDIVKTLENHFEILNSFPTGSLARGTAVRGYADLDIMVVLHFSKHIKGKKPSQVLQAVRDVLAEYKTNVRKNGQAVTRHYKTWPAVDIVPVSRTTDDQNNILHYNVPISNNETWIESKPIRHGNSIAAKVAAYGGGFLNVIQMAKVWNHGHSDYLESFHIEVMALQTETSDFYDLPWAVFQYFEKAHELVQGSLWYEGARADSYLGGPSRQEALKRLKTAENKARMAWHLTYNGRNEHRAAIELWQQIFGDKFPNYG